MDNVISPAPGTDRRPHPVAWLRSEVGRFMETVSRPMLDSFLPGQSGRPTVDLIERADCYLALVDLPGLGAGDVSVSVEGHRLLVAGERRRDEQHEGEGFLMQERQIGRLERSIPLPDDADEDGIQARLDDGLLCITMPRNGSDRLPAGRIDIRSSDA